MKTLSAQDVMGIAAYLSKEFGDEGLLRDKVILEKVLNEVNAHREDEILGKAAKLMEEMVKQAPFTSGNPRTAFFAADVLLRLNGYYLRCDSVLTLRFFTALLSEHRFTYEQLLPWIKVNTVRF